MSPSHLDARSELLARIDAATICSSLEVSVGGASRGDIYLFGYLSSMANSQYGIAPSAWGYPFAATRHGLPFSEALEYATDRMAAAGELVEVGDGFQLSEEFSGRFDVISLGEAFRARVELVRDVCNLLVFRALPGISRAMRNEPQLKRSAAVEAVRLIDEQELSNTLMGLMVRVRDQLPSQFAPAGPAMLWLDEWEKQYVS